jgi:hypothetical protein
LTTGTSMSRPSAPAKPALRKILVERDCQNNEGDGEEREEYEARDGSTGQKAGADTGASTGRAALPEPALQHALRKLLRCVHLICLLWIGRRNESLPAPRTYW